MSQQKAIYIQLSKLINQLNIKNYEKILKLIEKSTIDINEPNTINNFNNDLCYYGNVKTIVRNIMDDLKYISKKATDKNDEFNKLTMLEAIAEASDNNIDVNDLYHQKIIQKINRLFYLSGYDDWAVTYMPSLYIFLSEPTETSDPYELAHELGLDGMTYEIR